MCLLTARPPPTPSRCRYTYYNVTEHVRHVLVSEGCIRRCFERCSESCFERYCITRLEEPVNDTAVCIPQCFERFFETNEPDFASSSVGGSGAGGAGAVGAMNGTNCYGGVCYNGNVSDCQMACDSDCVVSRGANCSSSCDHLINPVQWQGCLAECLANASAVCARDCIYVCTLNHTLAYGYPEPRAPSPTRPRTLDAQTQPRPCVLARATTRCTQASR